MSNQKRRVRGEVSAELELESGGQVGADPAAVRRAQVGWESVRSGWKHWSEPWRRSPSEVRWPTLLESCGLAQPVLRAGFTTVPLVLKGNLWLLPSAWLPEFRYSLKWMKS